MSKSSSLVRSPILRPSAFSCTESQRFQPLSPALSMATLRNSRSSIVSSVSFVELQNPNLRGGGAFNQRWRTLSTVSSSSSISFRMAEAKSPSGKMNCAWVAPFAGTETVFSSRISPPASIEIVVSTGSLEELRTTAHALTLPGPAGAALASASDRFPSRLLPTLRE